jgi:hypothetical protein
VYDIVSGHGLIDDVSMYRGNVRTVRKPYPVLFCQSEIPLGLHPGKSGGKPATNRLSSDSAGCIKLSHTTGTGQHCIYIT